MLGCRFILDKKIGVGQPKRIENAKILVANTAMDTDKVKIYGARVRVDAMSKVAEIEAAEKIKMKNKVENILKHGINCFVNRQLIYNYPEELFADAGIMAIEHADFEGIERLALVTGGEITSTFNDPANVKLGHCKLIEEIMIGEDKLIHFSGVALGQACTIVLRGARSASPSCYSASSWAGFVRCCGAALRVHLLGKLMVLFRIMWMHAHVGCILCSFLVVMFVQSFGFFGFSFPGYIQFTGFREQCLEL